MIFKDRDEMEAFMKSLTYQDIVYLNWRSRMPKIVGETIIDEIKRFSEFIRATFEKLSESTPCSHEIKRYVGFTDEYNYCTKCGERCGE